jgi:hypothetical protein
MSGFKFHIVSVDTEFGPMYLDGGQWTTAGFKTYADLVDVKLAISALISKLPHASDRFRDPAYFARQAADIRRIKVTAFTLDGGSMINNPLIPADEKRIAEFADGKLNKAGYTTAWIEWALKQEAT